MKKIYFISFTTILILSFSFFLLIKNDYDEKVVFFDIGQGDATLFFLENNMKVLVDCGKDKLILSKLGSQLSFFDKTIDYLIITHPDLDHYGGCLYVLQNYKVKNIVINKDKKNDEYYRLFDQAVNNEKADIKIIDNSQTWKAEEYFFEFLNPNESNGDTDSNNNSIVFRLTGGEKTFMMTGDLGIEGEELLVERYCENNINECDELKSDILKVGHHGSDTSSSDNFLQLIQPQMAIISVGKNSFGHPSKRVLNKLERIGAEVLRTDEEGDIIIML